MKKVIITILLILQANLYPQTEITGKEKDTIINNAIKINNYIGYKGDVLITVEYHEERYGVEGGKENVGKIYEAYFDLVDAKSQKIIFYADSEREIEKLDITLINKKLKIVYAGKDITANVSNHEEELSQYPFTLIAFLYNRSKVPLYLIPDIHITDYINMMKYKGNKLYEGEQGEDDYPYTVDLEEYFNGAHAGVGLDNDFRIIAFYVEDDVTQYSFDNNFIFNIYIGTMAEGLSITFLEENGWVKK